MENQNTTQNIPATTIGWSGVSLAFLANVIIAIKSDPSFNDIKILFSFAILCILINLLLEFAIKLYAPFQNNNTEMIQKISNYSFLFGLLFTASIIISIMTNTSIAAIFLAAVLVILTHIIQISKIKSKKIQPPTATEEQLTQSNMEESTVRIKCEPSHITKETEDHTTATVLLSIRGKDIILEEHLEG